jgi:hypothetical protein
MSISGPAAAAAIKSGLSAICAHCECYWEGFEKGCVCTAAAPCAGPLLGMMFPAYRGPISDFSRLCFVCGGKPAYQIRAGPTVSISKSVGVCAKHLHMVTKKEGRRSSPSVVPAGPGLERALAPRLVAPEELGLPSSPTTRQTVNEALREAVDGLGGGSLG